MSLLPTPRRRYRIMTVLMNLNLERTESLQPRRRRGMDSTLGSAIPRHPPPPPIASAPSFGGEWRLLEPPQQLYRFAEADKCSDDTSRRRSIGPTRTKPRNSRLSRAELKVRIHS